MRILGVDPGLQVTGYGVIEFNGSGIKLLEAGTIKPKSTDLLQNKVNTIHKNLEEIILEYRPDVMVLEKIYTHHQYLTTAGILGHARGVICLLCAQHHLKLVEQSVTRLRKAVLGKGRATKLQMQGMVAHALKIDGDKLTLDASDALALALGYTQISAR